MMDREFTGDANPARPERESHGESKGSGTFSEAARAARDAGTNFKESAADTVTTVTDHLKDMLDREIGRTIGTAGLFAGAVNRAAVELDAQSPIAASIVRRFADRIEQFAEDYEDETVEQLTRSASDFTRRQPALVFGLTALAGFLVVRAITNAQTTTPSPSIQPEDARSET